MQKWTAWLWVLLLAGTTRAQVNRSYYIRQYTTDNGLPSNGIKGLQWDERTGFLWIATEAGIVRFNGSDFRSYTKDNMPSLSVERMLFMTRNRAGRIYIPDLQGNIFVVEQNKPLLWKKRDGNANPYYSNYYLLPVSEQFFNGQASRFNNRFTAITDKIIALSDTACIILNNQTLFYHSISAAAPVPLSLEQKKVNTVFNIGFDFFIHTNEKGFLRFTFPGMNPVPVTLTGENNTPFAFDPLQDRIFWEPAGVSKPILIKDGTAWSLGLRDNNLVAQQIFRGIPSDALIRSIQYSEKNKTLFIGTDSKGLIIMNQTSVTSKKRKDSASKNRNSYYSQLEMPNGNVLTNEGDMIGDNPPGPVPVSGKFSYYVSTTDDSLVWYSQYVNTVQANCMHRYNKVTGDIRLYEKIRGDFVLTRSGTRYYLASPAGIGVLEGDSLRYLYTYTGKEAGNLTFAMEETEPGVLGIATCNGLFRFQIADAKLDVLFRQENICVRSIWMYKDYLFFGTYGSGFYIYKNGRTRAMPLDKNKYLQYAHCFVPDDKGYCWISTNRGLFKANVSELLNVFENKSNSAYYHYYGKKDGMEMTELNGGCNPCALRLKNKIISFPSMDGLLWVNPDEVIPVLPEGDIFIDEVQIDNVIRDPEYLSGKSLPPKTGEIVLRLAYSAWCNNENIYLEYQLNDTVTWKPVSLGNVPEIRFNNLLPGKYTLRIRKMNGFGFSNYTYRTIRFSITTPWTQRWWFYLLSLATVLGLLALYLRFRTRQYEIRERKLKKQVAEKTKELQEQNEVLEKNNSIKTRLISIISHDIITPLKFVTVAGKNLLEKRKLMPEELQQETIREMTNTSQELQLLSTNILNWIKYQNENRRMGKETFNLHEMVSQVLGILQSLARQKNLVILNQVDPGLEIHQYYEPLKILVYNLLTNAIQFTEKGSIAVSAEPAGELLRLSVTDEGTGMTPEQIQRLMAEDVVITSANVDNKRGHGLGYLIIKDLLKTMNAGLAIESEKGKGTAVSISFPYSRNGGG